MYKKDFDKWNDIKKITNQRPKSTFFKERDVWWCSLGVNIGSEEDGKNSQFERPVLVIRKFNNNMAWVLPMSSKQKANRFNILLNNRSIILSQLRTISTKRFSRYVDRITTYELAIIRGSIIEMLR